MTPVLKGSLCHSDLMALAGSLHSLNHLQKVCLWDFLPLRQGLSLQTVRPEMYYVIQAILRIPGIYSLPRPPKCRDKARGSTASHP